MYLFHFDPETEEVTFSDFVEYEQCKSDPQNKVIMDPIDYFMNNFGSIFKVLERLGKVANYWLQRPDDDVVHHIEQVKSSIVNFLMTQDVSENRKLRQGKQTTHEVYGIAHTLSSTLYAPLALHSMREYEGKEHDIVHIPVQYTKRSSMHIDLADSAICPTEELYHQICGIRGSLMHITSDSFNIRNTCGTEKVNLLPIMSKIKVFVSIVDECRRLARDDTEDIEAGHFSYPMIYAINNNKEDGELLLAILRRRSHDEIVLNYALTLLKNSGCLENAKQKLRLLRKEIMDEYSKLKKNPFMDDFAKDYLEVPEDFKDISWAAS